MNALAGLARALLARKSGRRKRACNHHNNQQSWDYFFHSNHFLSTKLMFSPRVKH